MAAFRASGKNAWRRFQIRSNQSYEVVCRLNRHAHLITPTTTTAMTTRAGGAALLPGFGGEQRGPRRHAALPGAIQFACRLSVIYTCGYVADMYTCVLALGFSLCTISEHQGDITATAAPHLRCVRACVRAARPIDTDPSPPCSHPLLHRTTTALTPSRAWWARRPWPNFARPTRPGCPCASTSPTSGGRFPLTLTCPVCILFSHHRRLATLFLG